MGHGPRDYDRVEARARSLRARDASALIDLLWDELSPTGVSWVGIYHKSRDGDELVLGDRRDKPACSPIGLHGACGRCWLSRRPLVVDDVALLGDGYVACDPRDRSEAIVPLIDVGGGCWGVLDLDSFDVGAFDRHDVDGLVSALQAVGLTDPAQFAGPIDHLSSERAR